MKFAKILLVAAFLVPGVASAQPTTPTVVTTTAPVATNLLLIPLGTMILGGAFLGSNSNNSTVPTAPTAPVSTR
jgi:hypothetical protein